MQKNIITHDDGEQQKKEYESEMKILDAYRSAFREDVRTVIREEWGEHLANKEEINAINFWLMKIGEKRPVYLVPIFAVITFFWFLFEMFFKR